MRSKKSGNKTPHFPLPNSLISNSQSKVVMSNSSTQNPNTENMQTLKTPQTTKIETQKQDFLTIKDVSKVYETPKGPYVVLDGVNLTINEGEFICLIGHSGCGKSTLLNMIAGFNGPTNGEVALEGSQITEPGPDRMVCFKTTRCYRG